MKLKSSEIKNFRKINELEVEFPPGLSVIVGEKKVSKGQFAQELASFLEETSMSREDVPRYILESFEYLGVIETEDSDE